MTFPKVQWTIAEDHLNRVALVGVSTQHGDDGDESVQGEMCDLDWLNQRVISSVCISSVSMLPDVKQTATTDVKVVATQLEGPTTPNAFASEGRRSDVTPESLADRWMIGLEQA